MVVVATLVFGLIHVLITTTPSGKTVGHYYFESVVGISGAALSLFACIMLWMTTSSTGGVMGRGLTIYAIGTVVLFVGMLTFGLHGVINIPTGEVTRLILRSCVLIATACFFLGSAAIANETLKE